MFAVEYSYDPAKNSARDVHRAEHRAWLGALVEAGTVVSSGPYTDGSGALLLFAGTSAPDADALREMLRQDPFARAGLIEAVRISEWQPVLGAHAPRG
jgi:uncharacterized protein YciI